MSLSDRLDGLQRRHTVLGFPLASIYKFFDDSGNYLAALLAYYALIAIVPLLLLGSTILGFVLHGHPDLQRDLFNSALGQIPVIGGQLRTPQGYHGSVGAVVVGILGALYGAHGAAQALQYAGNTIWHVPRNSRPNPFLMRARSVLLVAAAGLGMLVVSIGVAVLHSFFHHTFTSKALIFLGGVVVATVVLMAAFQLAPNRRLGLSALVPGALIAAILLQVLQEVSYVYVDRIIGRAGETNAFFAGVLGLLAYLYLASLAVIWSMEVNNVYSERLWPRALLTPFTDNVQLTEADRRVYVGQARTQRNKGFQYIDVSFDKDREAREPHTDEGHRGGQ